MDDLAKFLALQVKSRELYPDPVPDWQERLRYKLLGSYSRRFADRRIWTLDRRDAYVRINLRTWRAWPQRND